MAKALWWSSDRRGAGLPRAKGAVVLVDLGARGAVAWPIRGWILKGVYLSTKGVNTGVPRSQEISAFRLTCSGLYGRLGVRADMQDLLVQESTWSRVEGCGLRFDDLFSGV